MALLAIAAAYAAPRMSSFFRGRALDQEAKRLLSLIHFAQSHAVSEGVPVLVWVNPREGTYGVNVQSGYVDADERAQTFEIDSTLTIDGSNPTPLPESESGDEKYGLPDNVSVIRFNPDGFIDPVSMPQIVLRLGQESALQIVQTDNGLAYEIRQGDPKNGNR